jgi:hypothetical protein
MNDGIKQIDHYKGDYDQQQVGSHGAVSWLVVVVSPVPGAAEVRLWLRARPDNTFRKGHKTGEQ